MVRPDFSGLCECSHVHPHTHTHMHAHQHNQGFFHEKPHCFKSSQHFSNLFDILSKYNSVLHFSSTTFQSRSQNPIISIVNNLLCIYKRQAVSFCQAKHLLGQSTQLSLGASHSALRSSLLTSISCELATSYRSQQLSKSQLNPLARVLPGCFCTACYGQTGCPILNGIKTDHYGCLLAA